MPITYEAVIETLKYVSKYPNRNVTQILGGLKERKISLTKLQFSAIEDLLESCNSDRPVLVSKICKNPVNGRYGHGYALTNEISMNLVLECVNKKT